VFDIGPHFILLAIVALIVIGPKDMPKAMRVVGRFVGKARGMANQFRSGFDAMVREAELEEMEKKWKEENARIMAEHSSLTDFSTPTPTPTAEPAAEIPALPAPASAEEKPA
jgi:sec-independent protein translocase protein TatB